jgi:hypothetical protein
MNGARDIDEVEASGDGEPLDPRDAAKLLEQSRRDARRGFNVSPPLLSLLGAAVVLAVCGVVWLSVRGQHPYKGPTAPALVFLYGVLIAWIVVVVNFTKRATAGVSGRTIRQQRGEAATVVIALIAVSVFQGVLRSDGVGFGIVYGIYPITAQLIVLGALSAAGGAAREDWPRFIVSLAVVCVAAGSAFAGPVGVWLSDGIGCAAVVLISAAAKAFLARTPWSVVTATASALLEHTPWSAK